MVITRYPSTYTIVSGTWNNPQNAYTNDGIYMVTPGARNTNWEIRFYGFGFNIPAGAIINSVVWEMEYKLSTTASSGTITFLSKYNGTTRGTNWVSSSEPLTDTLVTSTDNGAWTAEELNSNLCEANIIVRRGSNTACDYSFDFVRITVDYSLPSLNATIDAPVLNSQAAIAAPFTSIGSSFSFSTSTTFPP